MYRLELFLNNNLLRDGVRFENANLSFDLKHPIIIPKFGQLAFLIIGHYYSEVVGHCDVNTTLNSLC